MDEGESQKTGEFRGMVTQSLTTLQEGMSRIESSMAEIGSRVDTNEKTISVVSGKVDLLMWILAKISTPILGMIGMGIFGALAWHFVKK